MAKPKPDRPDGCPLFPHANGQWAKKVNGKLRYYGSDLETALAEFRAESESVKQASVSEGRKPAKPHPDFPLYAHASGRWAKKIQGKTHYFGPWSDPQGALETYLAQKDDLLAGREVRNGELTLRKLVNHFLTSKKRLVDSGELRQCTLDDYDRVCGEVIDIFGLTRPVLSLTPIDFENLRAEFSRTHGVHALRKDVTCVRSLFKYAYEADLIDRPVRFGPAFKAPKQAVMRKHREKRGELMLEAGEVRALIEAAKPQLKAMILLGVNCGYGNNDCAELSVSAVDLDGGWITFGRPKTGIKRRCPLWPETIEALREVIGEQEGPVFVTRWGNNWSPKSKRGSGGGPITYETRKLLKSLNLKEKGRNFYTLRRVFETVAGETGDQVAVDHIMGHANPSMAGIYRRRISDERLTRVVEFVRGWLFSKTESH
ncbi:MAG: tyrosine-type recombinase/integrase [Planctomycetota bacterium]